jgi:hypothetical protein
MSTKPCTNQDRTIRYGIAEELQNLEYDFSERNCVLPFLINNGYTSHSQFLHDDFVNNPTYGYMQRPKISRMNGDDIKVEAVNTNCNFFTYYEKNKDGNCIRFFNVHSDDFAKGRVISPFDCLVAFNFGGDKQAALEYLKTL